MELFTEASLKLRSESGPSLMLTPALGPSVLYIGAYICGSNPNLNRYLNAAPVNHHAAQDFAQAL